MPDRQPLLDVLASMPPEAFGWFVAWASVQTIEHPLPRAFQFPNGLGGFTPDSRESIMALRREAERYIEAGA